MYGDKIGSGDFGYGGADVNRFNGADPVKYTLSSGRSVELYQLPEREQTDLAPAIPESTQEKEDPDEKSLSDLNKGNMPQLLSRTVLRFVSGEKFNSSMTDKLNYLDGLIKGDDQNLKLDDSSGFGRKISDLKQEIQNNSKISRHEIYKEYRDLKQQIRQSQNQKCCDGALQELGLNKDNLPKELKKVYDKALSSKEPVDGEKFKKAAIKAHNKDVVDGIKKEIDDGKISSHSIAQKMRMEHFVSGALKQERLVNKDELKRGLDSKFSGSTGVSAEGIADSFAVDENANDDTGKNQKIDDDDNMNALLNEVGGEGHILFDPGEGGIEEIDPFLNDFEEVTGGDSDVQPETPENKGIPEGGASAVDNLGGAEEKVENTPEPGAEETTNPENTEAAGATDSKKTTGTNTAEEPFVNDFEEDFSNGYSLDTTKEMWKDNGNFNTDDDASVTKNGDDDSLEIDFSDKEIFESSLQSNENIVNSSKNKSTKNVKTDESVKKQKGQRQKEFINKTLKEFDGQPGLKEALENKLDKLNGKYHRLTFNTRSSWVISRAKKLQTKFKDLDDLKDAGKISQNECENYKNELTTLFQNTKSGPTHSAKFNAEMNKIFAGAENIANAREKAANESVVSFVKKNGNYAILQNSELFKNVKETFLQDMIEKNAKEVSDYGRGLANNLLDRLNADNVKITIADSSLKESLDKRLEYLSDKYGDDEKEFTARAQRMIGRAQAIESAIDEINKKINGENFTPTTQDSYGSNTEKKTISDENKQRFLDLLNIKTGERFDSKFNARLESLKKEILDKEIAEKAANENVGNYVQPENDDPILTYDANNDGDKPLFNGDASDIEDPFMKDFEEGF